MRTREDYDISGRWRFNQRRHARKTDVGVYAERELKRKETRNGCKSIEEKSAEEKQIRDRDFWKSALKIVLPVDHYLSSKEILRRRMALAKIGLGSRIDVPGYCLMTHNKLIKDYSGIARMIESESIENYPGLMEEVRAELRGLRRTGRHSSHIR